MATATLSAPTTTVPEMVPEPYRLSVDQYHEMIRHHILTKDDRVELIDGLLVAKMPKNPPHITAAKLVFRVLDRAVPPGWHMAKEDSVVIRPRSEPEPDLSLVRGEIRDYTDHKPGPGDVALVVEVSDSSYSFDRTKKLALYAAANCLIYWILNLLERRLEVYGDPTGPVDDPGYRQRRDYGPEEEVPLVIDGREVARIVVRDLLP